MTDQLAPATIRTELDVPLRFPDGLETTARVVTFDGLVDGGEHMALLLGALATGARATGTPATGARATGAPGELDAAGLASGARGDASPPLARLHSECLTGDVFGSRRCDCGPQLREAIGLMSRSSGVLLYLRQEGRGIGLYAKLDAYVLQDAGLDTYQANVALGYGEDERDYTVAAQMLLALGLPRVALLTNNPDKAEQLMDLGVTVSARVPTGLHVSDANVHYLAAKVRHRAHTIDLSGLTAKDGAAPARGPLERPAADE